MIAQPSRSLPVPHGPLAPVVLAPRFHDGRRLGMYDARVVSVLPTGDDNPGFLVRFDDGHLAGAFLRELRAGVTSWGEVWTMVDRAELASSDLTVRGAAQAREAGRRWEARQRLDG